MMKKILERLAEIKNTKEVIKVVDYDNREELCCFPTVLHAFYYITKNRIRNGEIVKITIERYEIRRGKPSPPVFSPEIWNEIIGALEG